MSLISGRKGTLKLGTAPKQVFAMCEMSSDFVLNLEQEIVDVPVYCSDYDRAVAGSRKWGLEGMLFVDQTMGAATTATLGVANVGVLQTDAKWGTAGATSANGYSVAVSGGNGSGATAAVVFDPVTGKSVGALITNRGSGYTAAGTLNGLTGSAVQINEYTDIWLIPLLTGELFPALNSRVYVEFYPFGEVSGSTYYSGYVLFEENPLSAEVKGVVSIEIKATGDGPLTKSKVP